MADTFNESDHVPLPPDLPSEFVDGLLLAHIVYKIYSTSVVGRASH